MTRIFSRVLPIVAFALLFIGCTGNRTAGERIDDAVITSKVEAKLAADPEVSAFNVDVDTENGVVRLSGVVEKAGARREAEELARNTSGVQSVINDITVGDQTMGDRMDDAATTAKIKTKLAADPEVNPFKIDVDTDSNVVTLSGSVSSNEAREEAEQLAWSVDGVKDVRNMLKVEGD